MKQRDFIYLGSQSASRQQLLTIADIPFKVLPHTSAEVETDTSLAFGQRVIAIAQGKMETLVLPPKPAHQDDRIFVLTADTMIRTMRSDQVFGKASTVKEARFMIATIREEPIEVATGCCLQKLEYLDDAWRVVQHMSWATEAEAEFIIDEEMVDCYFEKTPQFLNISGASAIEGFGQSFLKSVRGSHSAILGLPLFELRQALKTMGFRF